MLEIAETFKFNRHKIRTVAIDGQHWFIARDICDAIGRKSVQAATTALKSDEKKTVFIKDFGKGNPKRTVISQGGLEKLLSKNTGATMKKGFPELLGEVTHQTFEDASDSTHHKNKQTSVVPFVYQSRQVRTLIRDDEPWFVLADLCQILDITNPRQVAQRLDSDQKGIYPIDTLGGIQNITVVNEAGLYDVIFRSDKPLPRPFRRWITTEVLPTIRKTGSYRFQIDQFELFNKAHAELELCKAAKGLVDDNFLQDKVRTVLDRALRTNTHEHEARSSFWAYGA